MEQKQTTTHIPSVHEDDREMELYNDDYYRDQDVVMDCEEEYYDRDYHERDDYMDEDMYDEPQETYHITDDLYKSSDLSSGYHHEFDNGYCQDYDPRYEYSYDTHYHSTIWYKTLYNKFPTYRAMVDYQISCITVPTSSDPPSTTTSATSRRYRSIVDLDPQLKELFTLMARPLAPLVQVGTGVVHPDFPTSVLTYHLMTEAQLDSVAEFYHQTDHQSKYWLRYPCPVYWRKDMSVDEKREKMGHFIGITKKEEGQGVPAQVELWLVELEQEIMERLEKERREEEERECARRKCYLFWG
ncbi:hypothetical protein DL546_000170 [Coniochaeta pulveracea]|uniref:Uncharacterized protein n=1 Tax=Coniochaeta pulveracea TaxID=177199 RepID=A0A420YE29_9PEZI|nr:hypothetical protein DL546_000170 [Coniochaeta pulveracea]